MTYDRYTVKCGNFECEHDYCAFCDEYNTSEYVVEHRGRGNGSSGQDWNHDGGREGKKSH
jgi:hypothetical protein